MVFTAVRDGETLFDAVARAGVLANKHGESGYAIVCEKCGQPIDEHERPEDCDTWIKHLGVAPFER